jgi:hypothetical protein
MKWKCPDPARLALFGLLFWAGILVPSMTKAAANRVMDLKWIQAPDGRRTLALVLEKEPQYTLRCEKGSRVSLHLYDATPGANLRKGIEVHGKSITLEEKDSNDFSLSMLLKNPLREADCSWFEERKVLFLQMASGEEGRPRGNPTASTLQNLRFGPQEDLTRMVADLNARPGWEMTSRGAGTLQFMLNATLGNLTELIIAITALHAGQYMLVKASIAGAIVTNTLFMLGACFLLGGLRYHVQEYNRSSGRLYSALLLMASTARMNRSVCACGAAFSATSTTGTATSSQSNGLRRISLNRIDMAPPWRMRWRQVPGCSTPSH